MSKSPVFFRSLATVFVLSLPTSVFAAPPSRLAQRCENILDRLLQRSSQLSASGLADFTQSVRDRPEYLSEFLNGPGSAVNPWEWSRIPTVPTRWVGHYQNLRYALRALGLPYDGSAEKVKDQIDLAFSSANALILPTGFEKNAEGLRRTLTQTGKSSHMSEIKVFYPGKVGAFVLCELFKSPHSAQCAGAVDYLHAQLTSGPKTANLGNAFLAPILTTPVPEKGAIRAVSKVLDRLATKDFNGHLLDDVREAYLAEGFSGKEAEQWAWDLVFASFVHGQNGYSMLEAKFDRDYNRWTIAASIVISSAAVVLDSMARENGAEMYTLPAGVHSSCDNGRPYHFWVTAYSARNAALNGKSPDASVWSAYLLDAAYQMLSISEGRSRRGNSSQAFDGPNNDGARLDLSFASAGAEFGVDSTRETNSVLPRPSVDERYEKLWQASRRPSPRNSKSERITPGYLNFWVKMMEPGAALESLP